ncbi:MAG: substrate-binding domain-containing protein [Pseudonocardiaceae bacterium]
MTEAPNPAGAQAFVDYVHSEEGLTVLQEFGFITEVS